jgi:hypothetical protein
LGSDSWACWLSLPWLSIPSRCTASGGCATDIRLTACRRALCFHKLSRRFLFEGTWTTPARFAALIDRLRKRGYTFIDEAQYLASLEGPREDRSKQVFLTFDDGYGEVRDVA